jgi:ketosteroid isomerase-like protein
VDESGAREKCGWRDVDLSTRAVSCRLRPCSAVAIQRLGRYKAFFDQYDGPIEFEFRDLVIAAGPTFGYSHELQRVSGTLKGGQKAAFWLRVTDVYRKIGGQWRVVHEHVSVPTNLETGKAALDLAP